jgi:hypothetical protein
MSFGTLHLLHSPSLALFNPSIKILACSAYCRVLRVDLLPCRTFAFCTRVAFCLAPLLFSLDTLIFLPTKFLSHPFSSCFLSCFYSLIASFSQALLPSDLDSASCTIVFCSATLPVVILLRALVVSYESH